MTPVKGGFCPEKNLKSSETEIANSLFLSAKTLDFAFLSREEFEEFLPRTRTRNSRVRIPDRSAKSSRYFFCDGMVDPRSPKNKSAVWGLHLKSVVLANHGDDVEF